MNTQSVRSGRAVTERPDRLTLVAFALFVLIGGANTVAVRFSDLELPPFWGAAMRFAAAAPLFWAILVARRVALPRGRAFMGALLYGVLGTGASFALLYWGLVKLQASTTAVVFALSPLLTMLFAVGHGLERFRWRNLAGAMVALAGIALGVGGELGKSVPLPSLLAAVAGVACIAEAAVAFKLFPKVNPIATNAIATTAGAAILLVVSLLAGEVWFLPATPRTWAAFAYLVTVGSVGLFYLYLLVLARWTASATSYGFLLFPVVAVSLAAWLAHETVTPLFIAGSAVVLLGVWIGAIRRPAPAGGRELAAVPAAAERAPGTVEAQPCETC